MLQKTKQKNLFSIIGRIIAFGTLCFALSLLVVIRRHTRALVIESGNSNGSS